MTLFPKKEKSLILAKGDIKKIISNSLKYKTKACFNHKTGFKMLNINAIKNNRNSDRLRLITLFTFLLNDDPYTPD